MSTLSKEEVESLFNGRPNKVLPKFQDYFKKPKDTFVLPNFKVKQERDSFPIYKCQCGALTHNVVFLQHKRKAQNYVHCSRCDYYIKTSAIKKFLVEDLR